MVPPFVYLPNLLLRVIIRAVECYWVNMGHCTPCLVVVTSQWLWGMTRRWLLLGYQWYNDVRSLLLNSKMVEFLCQYFCRNVFVIIFGDSGSEIRYIMKIAQEDNYVSCIHGHYKRDRVFRSVGEGMPLEQERHDTYLGSYLFSSFSIQGTVCKWHFCCTLSTLFFVFQCQIKQKTTLINSTCSTQQSVEKLKNFVSVLQST